MKNHDVHVAGLLTEPEDEMLFLEF
jgi:hypothetical protein